MPEHIAVLILAAFVVGLSKGGLASAAAISVPMLAIWMDPLSAAALLLPVYLVSDGVGVWLYRHEFSARVLAITVPAGLIGVAAATLVEPFLDDAIFTMAAGLIGLGYLLNAWRLHGSNRPPVAAKVGPGLFWGFVTGVTTFISHSGGPPFQAYVLPQRLPSLTFAGTVTIAFAIYNIAKVPAYASLGLFQDLDLQLTLFLCAAAILGTFSGRQLVKVLPQRVYRSVIHVLLFVVSVQLLRQSTMDLLGY